MMDRYPMLWVLVGVMLIGLGVYMWSAPRRLFMRHEDPAEYRPEAVELDSPQGRWFTRTYPPLLIFLGLTLAAYHIIPLLSE